MSAQPPVSNTIKFKLFQSEDTLSSGVTVEVQESFLVKIFACPTIFEKQPHRFLFDSRWAGMHTNLQIINSFSGMEKIKTAYGVSNVMAVNIMLKLARGILTQLIYDINFSI